MIPRNAEDCPNCRGTGWDRNATEGGYSGVCGDCAGAAATLPRRQPTVCLRSIALGMGEDGLALTMTIPVMVGCIETRGLIYVNRWTGEESEIYPRTWEAA